MGLVDADQIQTYRRFGAAEFAGQHPGRGEGREVIVIGDGHLDEFARVVEGGGDAALEEIAARATGVLAIDLHHLVQVVGDEGAHSHLCGIAHSLFSRARTVIHS